MRDLVVSPSIREFPEEYYDAVKELDIMIVDDSDGAVDRTKLHKLKNRIDATLEFRIDYASNEVLNLIPRHNPSCKGFGLWYAWKEKYDRVILLDDDCDTRYSPHFMDEIPVGKTVPMHAYHTASGWLNTIRMLDSRFCARGYPYEHRQELHRDKGIGNFISSFNEGLWVGTPDVNGIDKLHMDPEMKEPGLLLIEEDCPMYPPYVALEAYQSLPLSIMNVQLETKLIPAFYQPPDYPAWNGFRVRRHDDVWSCYFLKAIMDMKGDIMTCGRPLIHHRKAGNVIREILSEHYTNIVQGYLTEIIDEAFVHFGIAKSQEPYWKLAYGFAELCMDTVQDHLTNNKLSIMIGNILGEYFAGARNWAGLFRE